MCATGRNTAFSKVHVFQKSKSQFAILNLVSVKTWGILTLPLKVYNWIRNFNISNSRRLDFRIYEDNSTENQSKIDGYLFCFLFDLSFWKTPLSLYIYADSSTVLRRRRLESWETLWLDTSVDCAVARHEAMTASTSTTTTTTTTCAAIRRTTATTCATATTTVMRERFQHCH